MTGHGALKPVSIYRFWKFKCSAWPLAERSSGPLDLNAPTLTVDRHANGRSGNDIISVALVPRSVVGWSFACYDSDRLYHRVIDDLDALVPLSGSKPPRDNTAERKQNPHPLRPL
jgi:hypothetical protein